MLAVIAPTGISGDPLPGGAGVGRCGCAYLVPTADGVAGRITKVPPSLAGGRATRSRLFGIASAHGNGNRVAAGFNRTAEPTGELRTNVYLGGGAPLEDELAEGATVVELGRGRDHPGELVGEQAPVRQREELEPPECVAERVAERARAV